MYTRTGHYDAAHLVISAGAWTGRLAPSIAPELSVERNVLFWFEPKAEREAFARLPVYIVEDTEWGLFQGTMYPFASDRSSYTSGTIVTIDGGWANRPAG